MSRPFGESSSHVAAAGTAFPGAEVVGKGTLMIAPVAQGDVLDGKYRVERVLGSGGMGVVVEAQHLGLDQRIAIKFLREESVGIPSVVERFAREARAMIRIKSEHVARVLDVGQTPSGAPYMVMEYLEGRDLSAWIDELRTVAVPDAVDIVLQACEAIAEAHSLGIIHRDLKPANLFLTSRADGTPSVKVLDFGISKVGSRAQSGGGAEMSLTRTAMPLGSPLYMAPEQIASARDVDERADIWSLGAMLYELVTGKVPFDADNISHLQFKILQETPAPLREIDPNLPEGLDAVLARCMRKSPEERYANIAEFASDLVGFGGVHAATSARRISAILSRAANSAAPPSSLLANRSATPARPTGPTSAQLGHGGTTPIRAGTPPTPPAQTPSAPAEVVDHQRTVSSWGATNKGSHRSRWLLIAAGPTLLALAVGAWLALRPPAAPATSVAPSSAIALGNPPNPADSSIVAAPSPSVPSAPADATADAAPSAPPPASFTPARVPDPRRPPTPPRPSGPAEDDLFNTRK